MLKEQKAYRNEECLRVYNTAIAELIKENNSHYGEQLRHCNAKIIKTTNFIFLKSYNTIIAVYDKSNDFVYDLLRYVYGYTHTSAQHIRKFCKYLNTEKIFSYTI